MGPVSSINPEGVHVSFTSDQLSVHSSVNVRKIKLIAFIYIHFYLSLVDKLSRRSHLQANREFTQSVCSNWGSVNGIMTFTTSNHIGESHVFFIMSSLII